MLSWITEKQDVWQRLQSCNKPVVVYGMGDGAVKILQVMQRYGIRPAAMFASDDFARGNSFMGYTVGKLRDVQAVYDDFVIVLAFAVRDLPTIERIRALSQQYELVAPDVPVAGVELFNMEFVRRHEQDFLQVEQLLADEQSRKVLHDMVNFKLSGKLEYLFDCETDPQEAYENILRPTPSESFADLGAYRGDTIAELMHYAGGCERVFAFEPDAKTYPKLLAAVEQMGLADRATCVQRAAYSHWEMLEFRQPRGQAVGAAGAFAGDRCARCGKGKNSPGAGSGARRAGGGASGDPHQHGCRGSRAACLAGLPAGHHPRPPEDADCRLPPQRGPVCAAAADCSHPSRLPLLPAALPIHSRVGRKPLLRVDSFGAVPPVEKSDKRQNIPCLY